MRVLVCEDWAPLAREVKYQLEDRGASIVGPVARLQRALDLIEREKFEVAVLDIDLHGERVFPAAMRLRAMGIPFIFTTGFTNHPVPTELRAAPLLEKPIDFPALARLVRQLL